MVTICVFVLLVHAREQLSGRVQLRFCGVTTFAENVWTERVVRGASETIRIHDENWTVLVRSERYVDIDGLQRGFSLPVSTASGTNTVERASFSGKTQKVGSSSVNTSSIPAARENVHVSDSRRARA